MPVLLVDRHEPGVKGVEPIGREPGDLGACHLLGIVEGVAGAAGRGHQGDPAMVAAPRTWRTGDRWGHEGSVSSTVGWLQDRNVRRSRWARGPTSGHAERGVRSIVTII
jgi:hypothetical protein